MKVSILINNYNYADFLAFAIESALKQSYLDCEVIVVDDGSTDRSRTIIESYGDAIVPVFKNNGGQASAFNAGFAAASGDIILLLDADDAFLPVKASTLVDVYRQNNVGWCFDRVTTTESGNQFVRPTITLLDMRSKLQQGIFPAIPVPTSGLSFSRAVLAQILPMPVANDVVLSDNYLKFAAAHLATGALIETPLTFQRLHGANRYTTDDSERQRRLRAKIMTETGYNLILRYQGLRIIGLHLIAGGFALSDLSLVSILTKTRHLTNNEMFGRGATAKIIAMTIYKRFLARLTSIL